MEQNNKIQLQKRQVCTGFHPCFDSDELFLLKYSPKYCKKLTILNQKGNFGLISSKIKKIKVLEKPYIVGCPNPKKGVSLKLKLLKEKRRHIKTLPLFDDSLIRYFPNRINLTLRMNTKDDLKKFVFSRGLKSLTLTDYGPNTNRLKLLSWQFWDHLKRSRLLKNLSIFLCDIFDGVLYDLLKKLDSYFKIANSINVRLNFNFSKWEANNGEGWNFPNLFRHVTNLEVKHIHYYQTLFLPTVRQFTNITHLVLKLIDADKPFIEFSSLEVIGNMPTLLSVDLTWSLHSATCMKNFLIHTEFPPSIKSITLQLLDIDWSPLILNPQDWGFYEENPFEKDQTCTTFYKKWSNLKSLESLDFTFILADQRSISSGLFLIPILRNLSNLIRISYHHRNGHPETVKRTLVFMKFLEAISHLKPTLRVLEISDPLVLLDDLNPHNLPPLSLQILKINGYIIGDSKTHLLANFFSKTGKKSGLNEDNKLSLSTVMIQNNASFVLFLSDLNKFAKRKMTVEIIIDIRNVSQEFFFTSLLDFVREGNRIPNLMLRIMGVSREEINRKELKTLLCEHHTFKSLELNLESPDDIFFLFINSKHEFESQTKKELLDKNTSDGEEEDNSIELDSDEFSDDDDYIDDGVDCCNVDYWDEDSVEFFSDSMSNIYRKISD